MAARIYIVRHGETDENRTGIIQGQLDTQLNAAGVQQAHLVAEALKDVPFAMAFSSDLGRAVKVGGLVVLKTRRGSWRCLQTAEAIMTHHPDVPLTRQSSLRERVGASSHEGVFQMLMSCAVHGGPAGKEDYKGPGHSPRNNSVN